MDSDAIALFRELADRSPSEREAYYEQHHVSGALRAEVESLLRFDGDTADSLHRHVAAAAQRAVRGHPGAAVDRYESTRADPTTSDPTTPAPLTEADEGRFPSGTLLGGRYRIISLLGRGGMGEVYRATDLVLRQQVALKFLPGAAAGDARLLARIHREVRLARQISHPNVCRVYDIAEVDGAAFITMEYIDGEDLASLLRRIGRLPHDKALEIARRLCAGLAAAHDKGVVHRDLKPANIMIDGRGQVFITDFGLAATVRELAHTQVRSGTPAYMAPEQLEGREVSMRSDLYALGLVLYEMFSGRPTFDRRRTSTDRPARLSSIVRDVEPAVVRAVERCLEPDPRDRPSSALAVGAALPGGNLLAEALAAGITPSPQMVAAAHGGEMLPVRIAVGAFAAVVLGLTITMVLGSRVSLFSVTPFPLSPPVLEQRARELLASFGYTAAPRDRDWVFAWNGNYHQYAEVNLPLAEYRAQLAAAQPPLVRFRYRQSSQPLLFFDPAGDIMPDNLPMNRPGEELIWLDPLGRLVYLETVPSVEEYARESVSDFDWQQLFAAAQVDRTRFTAAAPQWVPPVTFDARAAWTGTYAHSPSARIRIEAAAWKGRPVYFRILDPGAQLVALQPNFGTRAYAVGLSLYRLMPWPIVAAAALVAWRNQRARRCDVRGALRLGTVVLGCSLVGWALTAHHVVSSEYLPAVFRALSAATLQGIIGGVLYMAIEPFVRRRWPQSLITWTRMLRGRARDPLVGGHVLLGSACGLAITIAALLKMQLLLDRGSVTLQNFWVLHGPGWTVGYLLWNLVWWSVVQAIGVLVLFVLFRIVFRREWLSVAAVVMTLSVVPILLGPRPLTQMAFEVPAAAASVWILVRLGLLPVIVAFFVSQTAGSFPLTTDWSGWYAGPTLWVAGCVLALGIWSFSVALAGRPLIQDEFEKAA